MPLQHSGVLRKIPVTSWSEGQAPRDKHPLAAKTKAKPELEAGWGWVCSRCQKCSSRARCRSSAKRGILVINSSLPTSLAFYGEESVSFFLILKK